jgi:hypothetical protein
MTADELFTRLARIAAIIGKDVTIHSNGPEFEHPVCVHPLSDHEVGYPGPTLTEALQAAYDAVTDDVFRRIAGEN